MCINYMARSFIGISSKRSTFYSNNSSSIDDIKHSDFDYKKRWCQSILKQLALWGRFMLSFLFGGGQVKGSTDGERCRVNPNLLFQQYQEKIKNAKKNGICYS